MQHCPYLAGAFNHTPQCVGFGLTSDGAYTFLGNVVRVALRVVNTGLQSYSHKSPSLDVGLLTLSFPFPILRNELGSDESERTGEVANGEAL